MEILNGYYVSITGRWPRRFLVIHRQVVPRPSARRGFHTIGFDYVVKSRHFTYNAAFDEMKRLEKGRTA